MIYVVETKSRNYASNMEHPPFLPTCNATCRKKIQVCSERTNKENANDVTRSCVIKVGGRNTLGLMEEFVFFWNIFKTKRFTKKLKRMKFIALVISYIMDLI